MSLEEITQNTTALLNFHRTVNDYSEDVELRKQFMDLSWELLETIRKTVLGVNKFEYTRDETVGKILLKTPCMYVWCVPPTYNETVAFKTKMGCLRYYATSDIEATHSGQVTICHLNLSPRDLSGIMGQMQEEHRKAKQLVNRPPRRTP